MHVLLIYVIITVAATTAHAQDEVMTQTTRETRSKPT